MMYQASKRNQSPTPKQSTTKSEATMIERIIERTDVITAKELEVNRQNAGEAVKKPTITREPKHSSIYGSSDTTYFG